MTYNDDMKAKARVKLLDILKRKKSCEADWIGTVSLVLMFRLILKKKKKNVTKQTQTLESFRVLSCSCWGVPVCIGSFCLTQLFALTFRLCFSRVSNHWVVQRTRTPNTLLNSEESVLWTTYLSWFGSHLRSNSSCWTNCLQQENTLSSQTVASALWNQITHAPRYSKAGRTMELSDFE